MYPLGKQFELNYPRCKANPKAMISGNKYRITVLTERVVRLEYSPTGDFVDRPTQLIINRNLKLPSFNVNQDKNVVSIDTRFFSLSYVKEQPFTGSSIDPMRNLKITLNSRERDRQKNWYYGHPEARNLRGNMVSIDTNIPDFMTRGLYSLDGFASLNDSNSKVIMEDGTLADPPKDHIDIYVFMYDHDFRYALDDYFKLTGAPVLPPRYAFGNWWSRNVSYNDQSIATLIRNFERKKIPIAVMLFDNDWHFRDVGSYTGLKTGYTFNRNLIRNPKEMIKQFHMRGIRVGLCINPTDGFYPHESNYQQVMQLMGLAQPALVKFDPLNPQLLDVLFKAFLHPLESLGVDFFWNDYNNSNNLLGLWSLNHYMFLDSKKNASKRGILLSRGSVIAPHKYGIIYGGSSEVSWEALRKLPFMLLNAANIGVSWWSHDVGGNHGGIEDGELYIRYIQLGTFSPILRFHSARGPYYKKEPWLWDAKIANIAADYLRLRHRLIPYLYTEAYNYTRTGTPLIQPFYYNYMWVYDDELYRNQYYFGSQLLVCPILDKKDTIMNRTLHRFFMPNGIWYDFITGKKFPGNKKYVSFFRDEDYPVFAHAGSIIPLSNRSDYNNTALPTDMEIQIFPGVSNTYTLYEDDGVTSLYKDGYYIKTSIDYNYLKNNYTVIIRAIEGKSGIAPLKRNYKMVFRNTKQATDVTAYFNTDMIPVTNYVDGNDFIVEINNCPTIGQLTINCKGRDIEIDAIRLINDDVNSILMDLKIETYMKENIASIMFGNLPLNSKRVEIRKLKKKGLSKEYITLFLKLLEYISEV